VSSIRPPRDQYGPERVNTAEHKALALESARRGMVLLKNRKASALPLPSLSKLAVIGPHANASLALLGNYYGRPETIITPLQGLQR
jgi:beta-glucosidase-like glycosyl hydrolase